MHSSSFEMMRSLRVYIKPGSRLLDVGGADVNGSYKDLFPDCSYTSLDFQDGADIVVTGYDWPIRDETYDAVISGQTFEHDRFFWVTAENIARVLKPGGIAIIIAPSAGGVHRHPVDCYRFYPDSMQAIGDWAGLQTVEWEIDVSSKWRDMGGVFYKPTPDKPKIKVIPREPKKTKTDQVPQVKKKKPKKKKPDSGSDQKPMQAGKGKGKKKNG